MALRLQLAAQLSSQLPLLQSEEELTVRAKGPRLQLAALISSAELQPQRPEEGKARAMEQVGSKRRALVKAPPAVVLIARLSVVERRPFDAAQSVECS